MKQICMTGSPKSAGFSTKSVFFEQLEPFGFEEVKRIAKTNPPDILVTNTPDSTTSKMELAKELNVEIMTYEEMKDMFELEGDS